MTFRDGVAYRQRIMEIARNHKQDKEIVVVAMDAVTQLTAALKKSDSIILKLQDGLVTRCRFYVDNGRTPSTVQCSRQHSNTPCEWSKVCKGWGGDDGDLRSSLEIL